MDEDYKPHHLKNKFSQFEADKVKHNTDTLDGRGTLHGMGIIACSILNKDITEKK